MDAALVLTLNSFTTPFAKTAHGLVRGPSRYPLAGLVDSANAGADAGEILDGRHRGIPIFASLAEAMAVSSPRYAIVGVATPGGVLPPPFRQVLLEAVECGLGLVNGLHQLLGDDAELAAAATLRGVEIIDLRKPKATSNLHFWTGAISKVRACRLAVLGTDCAVGKRTTSLLLADACRQHGIRAEVIYTGQTGWLQGLRYGFILDATPNDFVSGELEHAILTCDREASPDVILVEGQSALRNPSGPCGAELLLSAAADGVLLQHAPARRFFEDLEPLGLEIPPLTEELALIQAYGQTVQAITLNHKGLEPDAREAVRKRIASETGLPVIYPLIEGTGALLPVVRSLLATRRAP